MFNNLTLKNSLDVRKQQRTPSENPDASPVRENPVRENPVRESVQSPVRVSAQNHDESHLCVSDQSPVRVRAQNHDESHLRVSAQNRDESHLRENRVYQTHQDQSDRKVQNHHVIKKVIVLSVVN